MKGIILQATSDEAASMEIDDSGELSAEATLGKRRRVQTEGMRMIAEGGDV